MNAVTFKQGLGALIICVYLFLVYKDAGSATFRIEWQTHLLAGLTAGSLFGFDFLRGMSK